MLASFTTLQEKMKIKTLHLHKFEFDKQLLSQVEIYDSYADDCILTNLRLILYLCQG